MLDQTQIINLFREKGVILDGHFLLTSGRHSDRYMQCAKLFQYPQASRELCKSLAKNIAVPIDVVAGPALGGIIMAYEMGAQLGAKNIFAERVNGKMVFRRGFELLKGENVLVTEDVVTTGGSVKEVIKLVEDADANVVGVACIVDRSAGKVDFGIPLYSVIKVDAVSYLPEECPLCKAGQPVVKPGSRT